MLEMRRTGTFFFLKLCRSNKTGFEYTISVLRYTKLNYFQKCCQLMDSDAIADMWKQIRSMNQNYRLKLNNPIQFFN